MVETMGSTPEEVRQTIRAQMEAAEKRAQNARELVEILKTARTRGHDAQGDVEVEIDSDGRLVKLSIDDDALQGSARERSWRPTPTPVVTCVTTCACRPPSGSARTAARSAATSRLFPRTLVPSERVSDERGSWRQYRSNP